MSRTATTPRPAASSPPPRARRGAARPKEGHRETVEAIVVAFILALLVRGFEAEAFVIPTGSMAPTLMGRHKEVTCPQCGHVYAVNASEEVEGVAGDRLADSAGSTSGICVNCRFQARLDRRAELQGGPHPGDEVPLRPALPPRRVGPRALGRGRLPLSRGARDQLHQAAGRPARRGRSGSGSATSSSSRPGGDDVPPRAEAADAPAGDADARLRRHPSRQAARRPPEWRRWSPGSTSAWREESEGDAEIELQYVSAASTGSSGPSSATGTSSPTPSSGRRSSSERALPRPPRPTLITDFYSYNTNLTERAPTSTARCTTTRSRPGCSRTGWAT